MGAPLLTQAERFRLGEINPAIVAFFPGGLPESVDLRLLFRQGLLRAAVVDRRGAERAEPSFLILTAANVADVSLWRETGH